MRVVLILFILFLGISISVDAQISNQETIFLKDGSVIKGQVIEDNEYFIKLLMNTGDTIQVGYKNIITEIESSNRNEDVERIYRDKKSFWNLNLRGQFIDGGAGELLAHIGVRLNRRWNVAMGLGVLERSEEVNFNIFSPSYLHLSPYVRYYWTLGKPRIYMSGSAGYSLSITENSFLFLSESHKGGFIANTSMGIHFAGRSNLRWLVDIGVSYQDTSGEFVQSDPWVGEFTTLYSNQYFTPTLGITLEF